MLRARAMESVFFMAFNVFAASADELHTALRNGTDYYKEAHRRAQIKILCNSAMPNAPFQNMHWDFPNFLSEHLAIGAFYPSNACVYGLIPPPYGLIPLINAPFQNMHWDFPNFL